MLDYLNHKLLIVITYQLHDQLHNLTVQNEITDSQDFSFNNTTAL